MSAPPSVKIKAGVRNVDAARKLLDNAVAEGHVTVREAERLEIVLCDIEDERSIATALSGVTKVIADSWLSTFPSDSLE